MFDENFLISYYHGNSFIHKLHPLYKILSCIFMFIYIIISNSLLDIFVIFMFVFVTLMLSDVSLKIFFNNIKYATIFIIFIFLFSYIINGSLLFSCINSIKFILLIIYLMVIVMTSSFNSIVYGIDCFLRLFLKNGNTSITSLNLAFICKFFPIMCNERNRIKRSLELRGFYYDNLKLYDKLVSNYKDIILIYKNTIYKIKKIRNNMLVRNYGYYIIRNNYMLNKLRKTDTILLGINVVVLIIIIFY